MKDLQAIDWSRVLWGHYLDSISNGEPLYLAVDGCLLKELVNDNYNMDIAENVAKNMFNMACNELYMFYNDRAYISDIVWNEDDDAHSLAICLAGQQVLAVEKMYDDAIYTKNAYFPRYRELLGVDVNKSSCPMKQSDFKRIWSKLEREIKNVKGASNSTITFREGLSLRDKNRAYPLSQALLNIQDINVLLKNIGDVDSLTDDEMYQKMKMNKALLSKRGIDIVFNQHIKGMLIKQIRNYNYSDLEIREKKAPLSNNERAAHQFIVYLEDGWRDETYHLYLLENHTQYAGVRLSESLGDHFAQNKMLVLMQCRDRYESSSHDRDVLPGEELLMVCRDNGDDQSIHDILKLDKSSDCQFNVIHSKLPSGYKIVYFRVGALSNSFCVRNGVIRKAQANSVKRLQLFGGVILDSRNNKYLLGYPPNTIEWHGKRIDEDEVLLLDKKNIRYKELFCYLKEIIVREVYLLEYREERLHFELSSRETGGSGDDDKNVGYKLHPDSMQYEPVASELEETLGSYYAFFDSKMDSASNEFDAPSRLNISTYAYVDDSDWIYISKDSIKKVVEYLEFSMGSRVLLKQFRRKIEIQNKLPVLLYATLKNIGLL